MFNVFRYVQGIVKLFGADGTVIGNVGDALKVSNGNPIVPVTSSGSLATTSASLTLDNTAGRSSVSYIVKGTWVGIITPQVSVNGSDFITWEGANKTTFFNSHSSNGTFTADIGNFPYFRLEMTSYTSGAADVSMFASSNDSANKRMIVNTFSSSTDGKSQSVQVTTIETEHRQIHAGLMFHSWKSANLGSSGALRVAFTTGAQVEHMIFSIYLDYQVTFKIFESPTTVKGSAITDINRSRSSTNVSLATIANVTSVTAYGAQIEEIVTGSSSGNSSSIQINRGQEFDLMPNTEYLFEVISSQNNNDVTLHLDHYRNQA